MKYSKVEFLTEIKTLKNQLKKHKGPVMIDVGASRGAPYSVEYLRTFKNSLVISLEPDFESYLNLIEIKSKLRLKDRTWIIFPVAITSVESISEKKFYSFRSPSDPGLSSLLKPIGIYADQNIVEKSVLTCSLLYLCKSCELSYVDFLKIDTQGNDLQVLTSLGHFIKNIGYIQTEVGAFGYYQEAAPTENIERFIKKFDFQLIREIIDKQGATQDHVYFNRKFILNYKFPVPLLPFLFITNIGLRNFLKLQSGNKIFWIVFARQKFFQIWLPIRKKLFLVRQRYKSQLSYTHSRMI